MKVHKERVYTDTSVFGGCFDPEFARASELYFRKVKRGLFQPVISVIVNEEIRNAPSEIILYFEELLPHLEIIDITGEMIHLKDAYIRQGILTKKWIDDALHVAAATVSSCDMILSWNFKHIVNYQKMPLYNAVNLALGYRQISIYSPQEVIYDEN
jgi:hypothetical protein